MLFEKLVEQHRVHCVVANGLQFPIAIASYQIGIYFFYLLSNQAKLRDPLRIELFFVTKGDGVKREYRFTCGVYRFDSLLESDCG